MESKLSSAFFALNSDTSLLIEPVWNRNVTIGETLAGARATFNRTSMELKPNQVSEIKALAKYAFNRTSMELKPDRTTGGGVTTDF